MAVGPEHIGVVAASSGAATAVLGPRRLFANSVRSWLTGLAVVIAVIVLSAGFEAVLHRHDEWGEFVVFMTMYVGVLFWGGAGLVVLLTTPLRRRWPAVDVVVNVLEVALLFVGMALWAWIFVAGPWDL
jgi:hypothetical protein